MNCLKRNLNIKNININIKHLKHLKHLKYKYKKTNCPLIENPSTRKPGKKTPTLHAASIVNPKQVI